MPCRDDYGPSDINSSLQIDLKNMKDRCDRLALLLCTICKMLEEDKHSHWPIDVYAWWLEHKAEDARRNKEEKAGLKREYKRKMQEIELLNAAAARLKERIGE